MRRVVTSVMALLSTAAAAGWNAPANLPGVPRDLVVTDAGTLAVVTSTNAVEVTGSSVARSGPGAGAASAFIDGDGCLVVFAEDGVLYPLDNTALCATKYNSPLGINTQVATRGVRFRALPGGYAYACSNEGGLGQAGTYSVSSTGGTSAWSTIFSGDPHVCSFAVSVLRHNAESFAVFGTYSASVSENLLLLRNGAQLGSWGRTSVSPSGAPRSVALIPDPAAGLRLFAVNASGGLETFAVDGGLGVAQPVAVPGVTAFRSLALYRAGSARFGVAVADLADGGTRVLSAVPSPDAGQFGFAWRESTAPPSGLAGSLAEVACFEGAFCGLYTNASGAANVATYANANAPQVTLPATVTLPEGTELVVATPASDPDGDAVWVSLTQTNAGPAMGATTLEDGVTTRLVAPVLGGAGCDGGVPYTFEVNATDGARDTQAAGVFTALVTRSSAPLQPVITPQAISVVAGSPDQTVTVTPNASECFNGGFVWSPTTLNGIDLSPTADGAQATLSFPRNVCDPTGRTASFVVRANSPWGLSDAGTLNVKVMPWGPPEPPFEEGAPEQVQLAGTARPYHPAALHVCGADGGVGPDVFTDWSVDGGVPSGTKLVPDPRLTGTATATQLVVDSTDRCDQGAFQLVAKNRVTSGGASPARALTVRLEPDLDPLTNAQLSIALTGPGLEGTSEVAGLNCLEARTLQAGFVVEDQGVPVSTTTLPVPGGWALDAVPAVCTPRTMTLYAVLEGTEVRSNDVAIEPPLSSPAVGELRGGPLVAQCEGPERVAAAGPLAHDRGEQGCLEQSTRWSSGAFESPVEGNQVTVSAVAAAWDALLDQQVAVDAVAFAGTNASAPKTLTVPVVLDQAFVSGRMETDAPLASETGILGVRVVLKNESGCAVKSARWVMALDGVSYVEGSSNAVRLEEGRLEVPGISLGAQETKILTFNLRPRLFGEPAPRGQLLVGQQAISKELGLGQRAQTSGCGCAASGGGAALPFGVLALLFAARRLRSRS